MKWFQAENTVALIEHVVLHAVRIDKSTPSSTIVSQTVIYGFKSVRPKSMTRSKYGIAASIYIRTIENELFTAKYIVSAAHVCPDIKRTRYEHENSRFNSEKKN